MEQTENSLEQAPITFSELAYGIIFDPQKIFARLAEVNALRPAFWLVMLYFVVNSLTNMLVARSDTELAAMPFMAQLFNSPGFMVMVSLVGILVGLLLWGVLAAIFNLLAELMGGSGSAIKVLTVTGISMLPNILLTPAAILFNVGGLDMNIYNILSMLVFLYTGVVLPIMGISRVHRLSTLQAVGVVLLPLLILIACLIFAFWAVAVMFATQLPF